MIYVLCGQICSGKSTFCKEEALNGSIVVNDDAIVKAVHADNYLLYDPKLKVLYKGIENQIITLGVSLGRNVVIDRPNVQRKTRLRYLNIAHSLDQKCILYVFHRHNYRVHAKRRFEKDARGRTLQEWIDVAKRNEEEYEEPLVEKEPFDEIIYV